MSDRGLAGILITGSVFEQDEGAGNAPMRAFSPYGLSKGLTWQYFRFVSETLGINLGKFMIPNAFGLFEEPRFCNYLTQSWYKGEVPTVRTPLYVRDNIQDLLASLTPGWPKNYPSRKASRASTQAITWKVRAPLPIVSQMKWRRGSAWHARLC